MLSRQRLKMVASRRTRKSPSSVFKKLARGEEIVEFNFDEKDELGELVQRMRPKFQSEAECREEASKILQEKKRIDPLPKIKEVRKLSLEQLLEALIYCPESDHFY